MFYSFMKRLYPKVHSTHLAAYLFLSSSVFNSGKWCWYSFDKTSSWIMLNVKYVNLHSAHIITNVVDGSVISVCIHVLLWLKENNFIGLCQLDFWQLHVKIIPKGTFNSCGSLSLPWFTSTSMDLIFMVLVHKLNVRQVAKVVALCYNI